MMEGALPEGLVTANVSMMHCVAVDTVFMPMGMTSPAVVFATDVVEVLGWLITKLRKSSLKLRQALTMKSNFLNEKLTLGGLVLSENITLRPSGNTIRKD
jgi:hypothetical protein